jgi:hypothetical protein
VWGEARKQCSRIPVELVAISLKTVFVFSKSSRDFFWKNFSGAEAPRA